MNDAEIRKALRSYLEPRARRGALVVPELGVCFGSHRVDVALADEAGLHGYEIKSDADTLRRLPAQAEAFSRVFATMTLVVGRKHFAAAVARVPAWWGVTLAGEGRRGVELVPLRGAAPNPHPEPYAVAQLLWLSEAREALRSTGYRSPYLSRKGDVLAEICRRLDLPALYRAVGDSMRARATWRSGDR